MKKKIISGVSLALVLVMFAVLLAGCSKYVIGKNGDRYDADSPHSVQYAEVRLYQDSDTGLYEVAVKNIVLKGYQDVTFKGSMSGLTAAKLIAEQGVKIHLVSQGSGGYYNTLSVYVYIKDVTEEDVAEKRLQNVKIIVDSEYECKYDCSYDLKDLFSILFLGN